MFYVALRILLYDKVRSLITLLGVVFAVSSLIFAQMGIYLGLMETSSVIIDHTPGDIWITSKFLMCLSSAFVSIRRIKKIDPAILVRG